MTNCDEAGHDFQLLGEYEPKINEIDFFEPEFHRIVSRKEAHSELTGLLHKYVAHDYEITKQHTENIFFRLTVTRRDLGSEGQILYSIKNEFISANDKDLI